MAEEHPIKGIARIKDANYFTDGWEYLRTYQDVLEAEKADRDIIYADSEEELRTELDRRFPCDPNFPELARYIMAPRGMHTYKGRPAVGIHDGMVYNGSLTRSMLDEQHSWLRLAAMQHGAIYCTSMSHRYDVTEPRYDLVDDGFLIDYEERCFRYDPVRYRRVVAAREAVHTRRRNSGKMPYSVWHAFYNYLRNCMLDRTPLKRWAWDIKWRNRVSRRGLFPFLMDVEKMCGREAIREYRDFGNLLDSCWAVRKGMKKNEPDFARWVKRERRSLQYRKAKRSRTLQHLKQVI